MKQIANAAGDTEPAGVVIARFANRCRSASLSASQRQIAFRAVLDTYAVAVAAQDHETVRLARDYAAEFSGGGAGVAWVTGQRLPCESAAWLNAIAAHVLDYDDVLTPMRAHVSATLVPALLALHDKTPESSPGFAAAYIAGFEVMAKFARVMALNHYSKGWHSTSALGILGVTVACCVQLDLDESQTRNALGLAVAQAAGTRENFGSMAKSFQAGVCAGASVRAALLAANGFTAAATAIDGPNGYMSLYADSEDLSDVLAQLGRPPLEIDAMGIDQKKYPCCYAVHRALDAVIALRAENNLEAQDITAIDVLTSARGREALITGEPTDCLQAKFSMEYALASALVDGGVSMRTFTESFFDRPAVHELMNKVRLEEAGGTVLPRWSEVTLFHKDGRRWNRRVQVAHGDAPDPLTDRELKAKAHDCFEYSGRGSWADAIATTVLDANLDDEARVSACLEHLPQQIISSIEAT
ncbi:MAG: MmgE/PrpD family protein [Pseudomonadota bacterium]